MELSYCNIFLRRCDTESIVSLQARNPLDFVVNACSIVWETITYFLKWYKNKQQWYV